MEAEQKLLGLLVFVANFTCLIMKEHCKINTLYTEVYKMTQQTKLTTAVGEQALGTIAVLAATYAPMSTDQYYDALDQWESEVAALAQN